MFDINVALIGLDTSHTIEFARRMQAQDCPPEQRVEGMRAVTCLRFPTRFQSEQEMDKGQEQLEKWGVKVTRDFDEAVADCDALMLEINDPAYHLEYFEKCAGLGKPIFLDKPLADNIENGRAIYDMAKDKGIRVFSASSLRFAPAMVEAIQAVGAVALATVYGPLGKAPAGSSIVWYGVHAFEMLQRAMGRGATGVFARRDDAGAVCIVDYPDGRRGVVELTEGVYLYGGSVRSKEQTAAFTVDVGRIYTDLLKEIARFFQGAEAPVELADTLEIMAMLDAAERSTSSGTTESL